MLRTHENDHGTPPATIWLCRFLRVPLFVVVLKGSQEGKPQVVVVVGVCLFVCLLVGWLVGWLVGLLLFFGGGVS